MGKAYRVPSASDRLRKQQKEIKNLQAINRSRNTPRPVASTAFAGVSAAGDNGSTGNFLRTSGDTMTGVFALAPPVDFSIEIDADGIIDIGESSSNSQYTSNIQFEDIQPNTFTLDTIAGAAFDGQILILRTFAPNSPITIAQATFGNGGNIQTLSDADFTMGDLQMISLIFDADLIIFGNAPGGTWRVLTGDATGGGGGLTEPVIFGINTLSPQTLPATTTIAWNTKNPQQITLDRAVEFDFTNLPANGSYEGILVIIDIDATGGFDSPIWPASLVNPPIIPTTALSRFSVMLYTIDNGTIVTHATSVGSSSSGSSFSGNLSDLVIDTTKNWLAQGVTNFGNLTGVTGIDMDGATATIQGVQLLDLFQSGQQIDSTSSGIMYMVGDLQSHLFKSNSDNIAQFEETTSNVFRLNMLDHSIRDSRDITFSNSSGAAIFAGASPAIGFDSVASRLLVNYPTGASIFVTENNAIGSTQIKTNSLETNIVNALDLLQLGVDVTVPTVPGEFRNDGTDVFVFSGAAVRNLSNIPIATPATTELDNLTTTSINAALLPNASATLDLGSELLPWRIAHFREIEFPVTTSAPTGVTDTQISVNTSNNMAFNNSVNGGGFLYYFEGVNKWSMTSTQFSGDFILLENSLTFNDSTTNPVGDGELTRNGDSVLLQSPTFQIQRATTGTFSGDFNLTKVDAAPSGGEPIYKINFNLFDSPTSITYAQIRGQIVDVTDAGALIATVRADGGNIDVMNIEGRSGTSKADILFLDQTIIKASSGGEIGLFVTGDPSNLDSIGSAGTLQIPRTAISPTTVNELDVRFGDYLGAFGVATGLLERLWVKVAASRWLGFDFDATITS